MTDFEFLNRPIPLYLIVLLSAMLWGGEYVRRDLWEPDEARFALVSKEMKAGNHWLVPYRQGEFYSHKPPMMFWLTNALSYLVGGNIGNVAPRLPSFLGAIMALWAASRLAALWFTNRAGWLTVLMLPSSFLFWNKGGFGQIDMLLCGLEMMAVYLLFTAKKENGCRRTFLAYVFMGLGMLTKGPVGLIIPMGVYCTATLFSRERPAISWWHVVWGPVVALIFPGTWLLLAWLQGAPEGYFTELIFSQNVGRLSGEFGGHIKPVYYYLQYLPVDFLPWTFMVPLACVALARSPEFNVSRRKLLAWIFFVVVFFSLSSSKRNLYILLVYPAAAILLAGSVGQWSSVGARWVDRSYKTMWYFTLLLGIVMIVAGLIPRLPVNLSMILPSGFIMLAGAWWVNDARRENPNSTSWVVTLAITYLTTFAGIGLLVLPQFDAVKTPDELIAVAHKELAKQDRIIMYQQNGEIFSLYTDRMGFMADSTDEVKSFMRDAKQERHMIIVLQEKIPDLTPIVGQDAKFHYFNMGSKKLAWILLN